MLEVIESAIHRIKLKGTDVWKQYSYWTKAKDVEFETGKNAEETVADINEDIEKEISRAIDVENNLGVTKANVNSPTFTGIPKAPTASAGTSTTQIATTAFVKTEINNLINGAPETANTLKELSDLIEEHKDVTDALDAAIGNKVDKEDGKGLSSNDYTTAEKTKLFDIATGAEVNQNAFSNITIGSTTISADSKTDTLTFVEGDNIILTPDLTNDKVTISAKDTTYSNATTSTSGLMSASDKLKLDNIESGANNYVLPTASSTLGGVKTTSTVTSSNGYTACPIVDGVPYYKEGEGAAYSTATETTAGIGKLYTATGTNIDGSITQSAISKYINDLNTVVGTTNGGNIKYTTPNLVTNTIESTTNIYNQSLKNALDYATSDISSSIIALNNSINNVSSTVNTLNQTGTSSISGLTKLYNSTGSNTDGTMTQKAIAEELDSINNSLEELVVLDGTHGKTLTDSQLDTFYTGIGLFNGYILDDTQVGWYLIISGGVEGTISQRAYNLFSADSYYRYCADNIWSAWTMSSGACPDKYWNGATAFYPYGNIAVFRTTDDSGYGEVQASTFTAYAFNQMSSKYAKENIEDISGDEASKILELRPVKFNYKNGKKDNIGLIAEEVLKVLPSCVSIPNDYVEDPNAPETKLPKIDYSKFVPYLIKEIQILNDRISKLESDMV